MTGGDLTGRQAETLVSVIIPTYNCGAFIGQAIDSVLGQSYRNHEIIVIDDGSTDQTRDVLKPYMDDIRYFYQENQGLSASRNRGIELAKGELIAFLDADDVWLPEKLSRQVEALERHPQAALVYTNTIFTDEQLQNRFMAQRSGDIRSGQVLKVLLLRKTYLNPSTWLISKKTFSSVGCFDTRLRRSEERDFTVRLAMRHELVGLPEPLVLIRQRGASLGRCSARERERYRFLALRKILRENQDHYLIRRYWNRLVADFYYLGGLAYLKENDRATARRRFQRAIRHDPTYLKVLPFWVCCRLPGPVFTFLRGVRKGLVSLRQAFRSG